MSTDEALAEIPADLRLSTLAEAADRTQFAGMRYNVSLQRRSGGFHAIGTGDTPADAIMDAIRRGIP